MSYLPLSSPGNLIAWARTLVSQLTQRDAEVDTTLAAKGTVQSVSVTAANGISGTVTNPTTTPAISLSIDNGSLSNAKLANVTTGTFKGRATAGTGSPEDLTATQATSLLNQFTATTKGLVPASTGGTVSYLRADGSWTSAVTPSAVLVNGVAAVSTYNSRLSNKANGGEAAIGIDAPAGTNTSTDVYQAGTIRYTLQALDGDGGWRIYDFTRGFTALGISNTGKVTARTLNLSNIPAFANESAAGSGGLLTGDVYKTSTGELRIKL